LVREDGRDVGEGAALSADDARREAEAGQRMAEQTTVHHWINTAIATVAFFASGASAYFSFTANKLSEETAAQARENIGISKTIPAIVHFGNFQVI
jgi:hypothetical protein